MARFRKDPDPRFWALNRSLEFDWRLAPYDIDQSQAHARGLMEIGVLSEAALTQLDGGLERVRERIAAHGFEFEPADEDKFLTNLRASMTQDGIAIIGTPSIESQAYASPNSKAGHVNCKSMPDFKQMMARYFHNVFMFSMNDEVVHTGYHKMAHYLLALGCERK